MFEKKKKCNKKLLRKYPCDTYLKNSLNCVIRSETMTDRQVKLNIQDKISEIVPELLKGKHIEIHMAKDNNIKIFVVDKKIIK